VYYDDDDVSYSTPFYGGYSGGFDGGDDDDDLSASVAGKDIVHMLRATHMDMELSLDFDTQTITGKIRI
jgi:hypothetical protein